MLVVGQPPVSAFFCELKISLLEEGAFFSSGDGFSLSYHIEQWIRWITEKLSLLEIIYDCIYDNSTDGLQEV